MPFIVLSDPFWKPCILIGPGHETHPEPRAPKNGVLLYCTGELKPTWFSGRRLAQLAVTRTMKYFKEQYKIDLQAEGFRILDENQYDIELESRTAAGRRKARQIANTRNSSEQP